MPHYIFTILRAFFLADFIFRYHISFFSLLTYTSVFIHVNDSTSAFTTHAFL